MNHSSCERCRLLKRALVEIILTANFFPTLGDNKRNPSQTAAILFWLSHRRTPFVYKHRTLSHVAIAYANSYHCRSSRHGLQFLIFLALGVKYPPLPAMLLKLSNKPDKRFAIKAAARSRTFQFFLVK